MGKLEFLLLWVLGGNILDSGLRYENAGSCYAAAQNSGKDLQEMCGLGSSVSLNRNKFSKYKGFAASIGLWANSLKQLY